MLGGELLRSGLCGEWSGPRHPAEDVLPATLGLLRDRLPKVFGLPGCCAQRLAAVLDEMAAGYAGALRDRVRREQEEDLRRRVAEAVAQDVLTLLPHRAVGEQRLRRAFASSAAVYLGLCSLDLDGFGAVNDTLGHDLGDRLLVEVATRLHQVAAPNLVTRTGGDEFAVLVECVVDPRAVESLARRIQEALTLPFRVGGRVVEISVSVGVAVAAPATAVPADLLRAADVALSWAKAQGGGRVAVFDPDRDAGESARAALLAGLPDGVERGEFLLHYQPLVRLADGRVRGAEALVRWQHPEHGLLGPGRFIEAAERSGAIVPLGRWVLTEACRQAAAWWRELGPRAPYVSVNVSPVQLAEPDWVARGHRRDGTHRPAAVAAAAGDHRAGRAARRGGGDCGALGRCGPPASGSRSTTSAPATPAWPGCGSSPCTPSRSTAPSSTGCGTGRRSRRPLDRARRWSGWRTRSTWRSRPNGWRPQSRWSSSTALGCDLGQGRWFGDAGPAAWVAGPLAA